MSRPTARREFLLDSAKMACGVGALGLGLAAYSTHGTPLIAPTVAEWGSDPNSGSRPQTSPHRNTELGSDPFSAVRTVH